MTFEPGTAGIEKCAYANTESLIEEFDKWLLMTEVFDKFFFLHKRTIFLIWLIPNSDNNFPPANVMFVVQVLFNQTFSRVWKGKFFNKLVSWKSRYARVNSTSYYSNFSFFQVSVDTEDFRINIQEPFNLDLTQMTPPT